MNRPINQVILGGDSMFNSLDDIDIQIQNMENYRKRLQQLKAAQMSPEKLIWNDIDVEISPMTNEQRILLFQNEEYAQTYNRIQELVQTELLNLVKVKIENNPEGKELLNKQLKLVKQLKGKIIEDTNREMDLFKRFKEYSREHPEVTYDEFLKANL